MVVLGEENNLAIPVDEMLHHTRAVRRAVHSGLVIADMPYGSYQLGAEEALHNAARFIKEAGGEAGKIEGGAKRGGVISALRHAALSAMGPTRLHAQSLRL